MGIYNNTYQNTNNVEKPQSLAAFILNFKTNFLQRDVEIVPGLLFNQYNTLKRVYFYQHNQFESGPWDDNGNPKYFYDLMTNRNDQATKNIDIDTKDCYIKANSSGSYLLAWLMRQEFMQFAKQTGFGMKLNELSEDLPDFGTVVWKKCSYEGQVDVESVDLINIINDPQSDCLKDGLFAERHLMTQSQMRGMKSWNQTQVEELINEGRTAPPVRFMTPVGNNVNSPFNQIDTTTPYYEVYELWGEIPRYLYEAYKNDGEAMQNDATVTTTGIAAAGQNDMVYVLALVSGVESGSKEFILYLNEVDEDQFPYKEVHYRRRKGRWLGVSNYELCFDQIEKANEVTNRFFSSLRLSLIHLYQTRDSLHVKNVLQDLLDGDVVVSKSSIDPIATEIRGLQDYKDEIQRIESKCDALCNSYEVVTGADLPSGTPFKLGQQQLNSATKLYLFIRQNMGLFIEDVFNSWLLRGFAKSLTNEHILELLDADDLQVYYDARKRILQYNTIKKYILETKDYPTMEQLDIVGNIAQDQLAKMPKEILVEKGTYDSVNDMLNAKLKVVVTNESEDRGKNIETLTTTLQTAMSNPAGLQDPRVMKLLGMVLEESGYSPLQLNMINQTPTNPMLNPAMQGGSAASNGLVDKSGSMPGVSNNGQVPTLPATA